MVHLPTEGGRHAGLKIIVASALTAIVVAIARCLAQARRTRPNHGNCLSSFVNGRAQGSQVSSDPGGPQASSGSANFCARPAGAAEAPSHGLAPPTIVVAV